MDTIHSFEGQVRGHEQMLGDAPEWSGRRERKALGDSRERTRISLSVPRVLTFRLFDRDNAIDNSRWLVQNWGCHA